MTVNSIDIYGIKDKLRKADANKELNRQALQLIDALERSNERWRQLQADTVKKLKQTYSIKENTSVS